jgi:trimeric autotransporter adhesin
MHHVRSVMRSAAARWPRTRLRLAVMACAFFGGCGTYLHDDALQKRTDNVVSTYKAVDIKDALASAVAAQNALDSATVQNVIARENAARDALLAPLMLQQAGGANPISVLDKYISVRATSLIGASGVSAAAAAKTTEDVLAKSAYLKEDTAKLVTFQMDVARLAAAYTASEGKGSTACPFAPPAGLTGDIAGIADQLSMTCHDVADTERTISAINGVFAGYGGEIGAAASDAATLDAQASAAAAAEKAQTDTLDAKKKAVLAAAAAAASDGAAAAPVAASMPTLSEALHDLGDTLAKTDQMAGAFGIKQPGTALANVKFRKTSLCDVIAAEAGKSCTGAKPDPVASQVTAAIGNISAGLAALNDPPDAGVTSVALAYQNAVGNIAETQIALIRQQAALHVDARNHLLLEFGYLQYAHSRLVEAQTSQPPPSAACLNAGFGRALTDRAVGCTPQYQEAVAEALVAVNQSFSTGLTVARVDLVKAANLAFSQKLQLAQQVANARATVIEVVINEIGAYGQGGVQPSTIAAFLQAFGIVAIAAK